MEQDTLVERGKEGDAAAFAELTSQYREMAFGYALAMLRDVHLAQDVTQEAFFSAYCNLFKLQDPRAFPGWLRGIVHHHCCRVLRRRQLDSVPLDEGLGLPSPVEVWRSSHFRTALRRASDGTRAPPRFPTKMAPGSLSVCR